MTIREALAKIEDGLEGVTPGPWGADITHNYVRTLNPFEARAQFCSYVWNEKDCAHIARCDPQTLAGIAALVRDQDAEIARLRSKSTT